MEMSQSGKVNISEAVDTVNCVECMCIKVSIIFFRFSKFIEIEWNQVFWKRRYR